MTGMQVLPPGTPPVAGWRWGAYLLRPAQRQLWRAGVPVEVEDRVLDLLLLLLQHRDRALDRQEVIGAIWGRRPVSDATLRQLVYKARRVVGDDGEHQATISTRYGRSLQWVAPAEPVYEPEAAAAVAATAGAVPAARPRVPVPIPFGGTRRTLPPGPAPTRWKRPWLAGVAVAIVVVVLAGVFAAIRWSGRRDAPPPVPHASAADGKATPAFTTLAVLPFKDLDPGQDQRYVSDGLTEELINRLARMPRLRVTARTSSFVFRDKPVDVREAARRLGVAHVLEGSVQRSGDHWRVRVALVDAHENYELWANEYDVGAGDLLDMEDRIASTVTATLYPKLRAAVAAPRHRTLRVDPAAHDDYLVGLEYLNRRTRTDLAQAIDHFQRALRAEPDYAEAWGGLAAAYAVWNDYDSDAPPDQHYEDALSAARRAVAIAPQSARAHAVLGLLAMEHWQWAQAEDEYRRALQIDPSNATAHQWYAMYLWYQDDPHGALAQMRIANRLDPLSPIINIDLGRALLYAGHRDQAVVQYREAVALAPRFPLAHVFLAEGYLAQGRNEDGLREARNAIALAGSPTPSSYLAMLGVALCLNDQSEAARAQLAILQARSREHYVSGVSLAFLEAQLGLHEQMFKPLFAAEAAHDPLLQPALADRTSPWYADPRMAELRARMGLPGH